MQLNEVIEENSIKTIAKRTRISVENIEKLVAHDFSTMKKVKAQGFISILEREFNLELNSLRKECSEYFSSYHDEKIDTNLVISIPENLDSGSGWLSKLLILILLFALGYGAWYFFVDNNETVDNNVTLIENSSNDDFIGKIIAQAEEWLGDSNTIVDDDNSSVADSGVWAEQDTSSDKPSDTKSSSDTQETETETNDSINEEKIIREAKEEQQEIIAQEEAQDISDDPFSIESIMGNDIIKLTDKNSDVNENTNDGDSLATEVPSIASENSDEVVPKEVEPVIKIVADKKTVIMHPLKKVWIGYTNLDNMKRESKVVEEDISFDTSKGKWIMVAGHGGISFKINGKEIETENRSKKYFLIRKGTVKSISQEEFQKLNKSKVW